MSPHLNFIEVPALCTDQIKTSTSLPLPPPPSGQPPGHLNFWSLGCSNSHRHPPCQKGCNALTSGTSKSGDKNFPNPNNNNIYLKGSICSLHFVACESSQFFWLLQTRAEKTSYSCRLVRPLINHTTHNAKLKQLVQIPPPLPYGIKLPTPITAADNLQIPTSLGTNGKW